ncbi:hypothetical protein [uncultured Limimaricola sp.]|uniref:hypothetical protein n=1 Tax=uncultured Limimaricola sp. TaxID=2211667 RepID=UPI0030F82113
MPEYPKLEISVKLAATLIAAFGVVAFFLDRSHARTTSEKNMSLSFIEKFASSDVIQARGRLLTYWQNYPEFVDYSRENSLSSREYTNFVRATYPARDDRGEVDKALFRMQVFFDELSYCYYSGICDNNIIDEYFCDYAVNFSNVYGAFYGLLAEEIGSKPLDQKVGLFSSHCTRQSDL